MTQHRLRRKLAVFILGGAALLTGATHAGAADSAASNDWQFRADVYAWTPGIGATTTSGGDIDIPFSTILQDLDMTFMGRFGARKGKWSLMADVIYLDLSQENSHGLPLPGGGGLISTSTNVELKSWIVTPHVGYNLIDTEKGSLDAFAGVRYLYLKSSLNLTAIAPIGIRSAQISDSGTVWDGIVGVRGRVNLGPKWFVPYYADIGAGGSKLTWQAFAGIGYQFKHVDAVVGYRYLDWKFKNSAPVFSDLNVSGPLVGVSFAF